MCTQWMKIVNAMKCEIRTYTQWMRITGLHSSCIGNYTLILIKILKRTCFGAVGKFLNAAFNCPVDVST